MRAARILAARPERAIVALAELCEERKDEDLVSAPSYIAPRLSNLPPQTPYTVGSQSMRPKGVSAPSPERLSPTTKFFEPNLRQSLSVQHAAVTIRPPPEHMAPKRGKWTSPPPAEAPSADHTLFESQLGRVLQLATSSTEARETCDNNESSSNSEFLTDEDIDPLDAAESDDVTSVKSFTEGEAPTGVNGNGVAGGPHRRPSWHNQDTATRVPQPSLGTLNSSIPPFSFHNSSGRVRPSRPNETSLPSPSRSECSKRPIVGPLRARPSPAWPPTSSSSNTPNSHTPIGVSIPLPPSPSSSVPSPQESDHNRQCSLGESSTVYYQTTVPRSPRVLYPTPSFLAQYQPHNVYHHRHNIDNRNPASNDVLSSSLPSLPSASASVIMNPRLADATSGSGSAGPDTPTPYSTSGSHSHSLSTTTITAQTPPPHTSPSKLSQAVSIRHGSSSHTPNPTRRSRSRSRSKPRSKSPRRPPQYQFFHPPPPHLDIDPDTPGNTGNTSSSPQPSSGSSPTPSTSTGYATSISRSPSPISPSPLATATPFTVQAQAQVKEQEKVSGRKKRLVFGSACVPDFEPTSAEA